MRSYDHGMHDSELVRTLWRFVRGEMPVGDFEAWVYTTKELEAFLGPERYFQAISAVYSKESDVESLGAMVRSRLDELGPRPCECPTLRERSTVPIGYGGEDFRRNVETLTRAGPPRWWLECLRCKVCGQAWLSATDMRVNDAHFLVRLGEEAVARLLGKGEWPADFDTYESVLRCGREFGIHWEYAAPLESKELYWSVVDLAQARPGIKLTELAALLPIGTAIARAIALKAVAAEGVEITFDVRW